MKKRPILIAEDSLTQAEMLQFVLQNQGFVVICGTNGKEALALANKHLPCLVISDILMPEMDGYALCSAIKKEEKLKDVPVLLLTTLSTPHDLIQGLQSGADSYLVKPYDEADLLNWVEKLLHPPKTTGSSFDPRLENFLVSTYQTAMQKNKELRFIQRQLNELNQNLQKKVREQTKSLLGEIDERKKIEKELKKAKEIAEQADHLKSAFLNNLSHEIRTPMNAILGFSTIITDPDLDPKKREEFAAHIETGCANLLGIIDSIVDLAVIESENIEPNYAECRINPFLESIRDEFAEKERHQMDKILFQLFTANKNKEFTILIDPARTKQILNNLLKNSLKFTETGYIEFGYTLKKKGLIEFFVRDSGIGIPEDKIDKIFDKFIKLEEFHTKKYSGTGVGLTITKKLVGFLGGNIRVESIVGKGSVFYVSFPLNFPEIIPLQPVPVLAAKEDEALNWANKRILVTEDEESNFKLIEHLLKKTNAEILWAKNGKEAVDMCSNGSKIDLILMDIQMPVMDGYTAMEQILKMGKGIPIFAQTAYALRHDEDKILEAGFSDLLTKPIRSSELIQKIKNVFNKA